MFELLQQAREVAEEAAVQAGLLAKSRFELVKEIQLKSDDGDLVTEIDQQAEDIIIGLISSRFPSHQIRSEESGWSGVEGDWLWLVDPLDGTNNYAIGMPVYGVSITLLYRKEPVLGVIYDSHLERLYVAERGKGANCNGRAFRQSQPATGDKLTLGWIQGHRVQKDPRARALRHHLEERSKRVMALWAPAIMWGMLARGDLDGIVLYNSEGDDLYAGVLLAKEAGAAVTDFSGKDFTGMNPEPYIIACHPDRLERIQAMVQEAMAL